jgi:hypothetical protein
MQAIQAFARQGLIQAPASSLNALRSNKEGALVIQSSGGKYTEAVREGRMFVAANQAAVALTAAMATTYTGLVLANPSTSNKDLIMHRFGFSFSVAVPTATVIGLMTGIGTSGIVSAITPRNRLMGGAASVGIVDDGATLPGTPVLEQVFAQAGTLATTGTQVGPVTDIDLDGSLIVTPGNFVAVYSFAACTASFIGSLMWEEVPR